MERVGTTQNKKIAVTGGIGSGKSLFCRILQQRGFSVFSCDEINRELWNDAAYRALLAARFPQCVRGGSIDKRLLSERVFSHPDELAALEALAHPRIMERLLARMRACDGACFAEVPLLYEGGYQDLFDGVIALRRPLAERVAAVTQRDGVGEHVVRERIARQVSEKTLDEKACILVENSGDEGMLRRAADEALRRLGLL